LIARLGCEFGKKLYHDFRDIAIFASFARGSPVCDLVDSLGNFFHENMNQ
jgi:hypothetical protein